MLDRHNIGAAAVSPSVTVAMPVYNAGQYLRLAVLSIVKQTFADWELIIIDDGSTDGAFLEIADITDQRIRILRDGKNKGLAIRLNECIDLARGKYFARMDADDVSYPDRLLQQVAFLDAVQDMDVVAVRAVTIDADNKVIGLFPSALTKAEICAKPWWGFYFPHPTWMGKIEWFKKYRYSVPAPYLCEDQELLLRSFRNSQFATVDEIHFAYRARNSVNLRKLAKTRYAFFVAQWQYFSDERLWRFAVLALATFFLKLGGDLSKKLNGRNFHLRHVIGDISVATQWQSVYRRTSDLSDYDLHNK